MDYEKEFLQDTYTELPILDVSNETGYIYFLYDKNEREMYIGKTKNIMMRVYANHSQKIDFKYLRTLKFKTEYLEEAEKFFIRKYCPPLNVNKYKIPEYIPGDGKSDIRKYLKDKGLTIQEFADSIGYSREHIQSYLSKFVRLGPKAAIKIENFTNGMIKKENIFAGNIPYKDKEYEKNYLMTCEELMAPITQKEKNVDTYPI